MTTQPRAGRDPDNVPPPSLELAKGVNSRPGAATWAREMHNVYRVSASPGVVLSSIELTISQGPPEVGNTFRAADGQQLEFLKIFGLDDDPTDNEADLAGYYEVGASGGDGTARPGGTYVVFPTLEPFKRPPPLRNTGALSGQPFPLQPGDVNSAIYDESNDLVRRISRQTARRSGRSTRRRLPMRTAPTRTTCRRHLSSWSKA